MKPTLKSLFFTCLLIISFMCLYLASQIKKNTAPVKIHAAGLNSIATESGCPMFPANNVWNRVVTDLPVHTNNSAYMNTIGGSSHFQSGFIGTYLGNPVGFPYNVVPSTQKMITISLTWPDLSDPQPYPIPANPLIQGPTDSHMIIIQSGTCKLYEFWKATATSANNEVTWDLNGNGYHYPPRPPISSGGLTSADAAGLPILPGLVDYMEISNAVNGDGYVHHAFRVTIGVSKVKSGSWVWPAYHTDGGSSSSSALPMGSRLRLKASYAIPSNFDPKVKVILETIKRYGLILADTDGSTNTMYLDGTLSSNWNANILTSQLESVTAANLEVVDESGTMVSNSSMEAKQPTGTAPTATPTSTSNPTTCSCQSNNTCSSSCNFQGVSGSSCMIGTTTINPFTSLPTDANKTSWCVSTTRSKGDTNNDGKVDDLDYYYYVRTVNGGKIPPSINPDITGEGEVGLTDRAIIVQNLKL